MKNEHEMRCMMKSAVRKMFSRNKVVYGREYPLIQYMLGC